MIATIRGAESAAAALALLQEEPFEFSEAQARAILDMQLRRLAALERQELQDEHQELIERIAYLEDLLANPRKIDFLIKDDLQELRDEYGNNRRTEIVKGDPESFREEDLVAHEECVITLSRRNYVKRTKLEEFRTQRRGGQGSRGAAVRDEDAVMKLVVGDTHDNILFFTDQGKVYHLRAYDIPDSKKQARGTFITNLVEMDQRERVTTIVVVKDYEHDFMVLATRQGQAKKTPLKEFAEVRRNGKIAMRLDDGDELIAARLGSEASDLVLVSSDGQAIRFRVGELRSASRVSGGVRGLKLKGGRLRGRRGGGRAERSPARRDHGAGLRQADGDGPVPGEGSRRAGRADAQHHPKDGERGGRADGHAEPRADARLGGRHPHPHEGRLDQPARKEHAGRDRDEGGRDRPRGEHRQLRSRRFAAAQRRTGAGGAADERRLERHGSGGSRRGVARGFGASRARRARRGRRRDPRSP